MFVAYIQQQLMCIILSLKSIYIDRLLMFKQFLLITILVISAFATEPAQDDQLDADAKVISNFLVDLIAKYDVSGSGAIPTEEYPSFLSDVFLTGNTISKSAEIDDPVKQLLLQATTGFAAKYNGTEVGIQEFYMDLVKDFTIYLTENEEKYKQVLEIFFSDTTSQTPKSQQSAEL